MCKEVSKLVTFLKFECDSMTIERIERMCQYHKLVMVAIDEDMYVFRVAE